jgi:hypothetical protein
MTRGQKFITKTPGFEPGTSGFVVWTSNHLMSRLKSSQVFMRIGIIIDIE